MSWKEYYEKRIAEDDTTAADMVLRNPSLVSNAVKDAQKRAKVSQAALKAAQLSKTQKVDLDDAGEIVGLSDKLSK